MVYTLAASLRFVLVSQFVGENHGCSKKSGLPPKAFPAAEELLNVTHDHSATRERGESKQRREGRVKKDKMKERNRDSDRQSQRGGGRRGR